MKQIIKVINWFTRVSMECVDSIFGGDHDTEIERIMADQRALINKAKGLDEIW